MTRHPMPLAALLLTLTIVAPACGGGDDDDTPPSIDTFFPLDNEVTGWTENTNAGAAGVEIADTDEEAWALIDGDNEPFHAHGFVVFARQHYVNGSYNLEARIWDMGSASTAETLYSALLTEAATYSANSWEDLLLGDESRIADTGASWWVNSRKGAYHVEVKINQTTASDTTSRTHAVSFATEILSRIP